MIQFRMLAAVLTALTAVAAQDQSPQFVTKPQIYPLSTCLVSGEELGGDAVTFTAAGRSFRTCCTRCKAKVEKAPDEHVKKLDEAIVKAQAAHYPLEVCVVSGEALGSMGKPVQLVLDGMLVQLCCDRCTAKAEKQAKVMADKVRQAAYEKQREAYPLATCVVSGEELGDEPTEAMFGQTLVRFCCEKCLAKFERDPAAHVGRLHEAWMARSKEGHGKGEKGGTPPAAPDKGK